MNIGIILIAILLLIPWVYKFCNRDEKNKENWENKDKQGFIYKILNSQIILASSSLSVVIILNYVVYFFYKIENKFNVEIESVLNYSSAQQLVTNIFFVVIIAYFQYNIQSITEKKNKDESEQRDKWHKEELKSERLMSFININNINFICINNAFWTNNNPNGQNEFVLKLSAIDIIQGIFKSYEKVEIYKISVDNCELNKDDNKFEFYKNIYINIPIDNIDFFIEPLNRLSNNDKYLSIKIEGIVKDQSILDGSLDFEFTWCFDVSPNSGYNENRSFSVVVSNTQYFKVKNS